MYDACKYYFSEFHQIDYVKSSNLEDRDYRETMMKLEQAQSLQKNGKFHEAINEYLNALKEEPKSVYILMQLALLTYDIKNLVKSLEYSDKAIEYGCDSHLIWYIKGRIHLEFNKIEEALIYLEGH